MYFAKDDTLLGMIAVADTMKEDSADAVSQMQKMGLRVVMLTGDNEKTANAIGREAGVDEVIAGVLPDGKEAVIRKLKENGKVVFLWPALVLLKCFPHLPLPLLDTLSRGGGASKEVLFWKKIKAM